MKRTFLTVALAVIGLWPSAALAADLPAAGPNDSAGKPIGSSGIWGGLYNGRTLGSGGGMFLAEMGWPGGTLGAIFGISDKIDLGVKASPIFAPTYETNNFAAQFGLDLRGVFRMGLVESDSFSLLMRVEPGVKFYTFTPTVGAGAIIDMGVDAGIHLSKEAHIYLGIEVPLFIVPATGLAPFLVQIPILPGGGFEYHVNDFIGVGGRFNAGPSIGAYDAPGSPNVNFAFLGQGFFCFRWDRIK